MAELRVGGAAVVRANAVRLPLRDESVDLIVSSPPYFSLRSYRDAGQHFDGQLGSEDNPQAFLEALWAVMAECWRVLKPTGSCFINLGDKYAGSGGVGGDYSPVGLRAGQPKYGRVTAGRPSSWTQTSAAWLAGVIDCDGSISVRYEAMEGKADRFSIIVQVAQVGPTIPQKCEALTGVGAVFQMSSGMWVWSVANQQARYVLERIWPWFVLKQPQAWAAIELATRIDEWKRKRMTPEEDAFRRLLRETILAGNRGEPLPYQPKTPPKVPLAIYTNPPRAKSLMQLPHAFVLGCIDQGWINRAEICWSKLNSLPESVNDRVRRSHEMVFHLTKQGRYFSAVDEVREPHQERPGLTWEERKEVGHPMRYGEQAGALTGTNGFASSALGKLPSSVWPLASEPLVLSDAVKAHYDLPDHFAAFPTELPRRLILGWSPSGVCVACGEGRRPVVAKGERERAGHNTGDGHRGRWTADHRHNTNEGSGLGFVREATITGYACACPTPDAPTRPAVVVDVFGGTGTVAGTARALGRFGVTCDLSWDYCRLAAWFMNEGRARFAKTESRTDAERQGVLL